MKLSALLLFVAVASAAFGGATVRLVETTMPTYPFSDPDPVPRTEKAMYPYFSFNGQAARSVPKIWKTVVLENAKTKVTLFPDIGGKVWGAVDKATGREYIYFNHSVKFRNIAMRGPWCSGGIEFNFGIIGHAPWTATPVDWCVRENADGSASCFSGLTELINGTTWQVETRLGADDDYFETRTTWHNGSGLYRPHYNWMNAAYSAKGDPRFFYPGSAYIGHTGIAHDYPRDKAGHDLSSYMGNDFGRSKSYHVVNGVNNFYGIWWPEFNFGSTHTCESYDKYGRKIFLWAHSREGGMWEDLLTDTDGQYIELQAGRGFHQPEKNTWRTPFKHTSLAPGETDFFVERWAPAHSIGTMQKLAAEPAGAPRPLQMPADFDWTTPYALTVMAEQMLFFDNGFRLAEPSLRNALAKDKYFVPAIDRLSALMLMRAHYVESRNLAERALSVNTYDPEANYNYGMAAFAEGDLATARERLGLASYSPLFRTPSYIKLAKIALRMNKPAAALEAARRAIGNSSDNPEAAHMLLVASRAAGVTADFNAALDRHPLCHGIAYEADKRDGGSRFGGRVLNELPYETYIGLGQWYEEAGLLDDAAAMYARGGKYPIALMRLAFVQNRRDPAAAKATLARAAASDVALAFPSRPGSLPALRWAAAANDSWKFRYYLAVLLARLGDDKEADGLLDSVASADSPVFYLYRAARRDGDAALEDLNKAKKCGDSWRVGHALYRFAKGRLDWSTAVAVTKDYDTRFPELADLQIARADALCGAGDYDGCIDYLSGQTILPGEFSGNAHGIWQLAWIGKAEKALASGDIAAVKAAVEKAVSYPENIGLGRPYDDSIDVSRIPERLRKYLPKAIAAALVERR